MLITKLAKSEKAYSNMHITIYSQPGCSACETAKGLMKSKNIPYTELILNVGQKQEEGKTYVPVQALKDKLPNAKSVPQIFEGNTYIGGLPELQKFLRYD